jgi:hypothetical protein
MNTFLYLISSATIGYVLRRECCSGVDPSSEDGSICYSECRYLRGPSVLMTATRSDPLGQSKTTIVVD